MSDWGKVPKEVFQDERLTRQDIRVLGILCAHANGKTGICTRRQEAIAEEIGASREGVCRALTRLVRYGYVAKKARAGMKRSLEYRVLISAGGAGQLSLFDQNEAPRQAKTTATKPAGAKRKRDGAITSVVTPEVTSVVTSEVTSIEQTPVNRTEPDGSAAARERPRPANDDQPGDEPKSSVVVALPDLRALETALLDAAGAALDPTCAALKAMTEPAGWIAAGCDLAFDVLPAVAALAARRRGGPVRSWGYFRGAVLEARDRRLEAARPRAGATSDPPSQPASLDRPDGRRFPEHRHGDRYEQPARSVSVDGGGRFAAAAARRRREISGGSVGGASADDFAGPVLLPPGSGSDR